MGFIRWFLNTIGVTSPVMQEPTNMKLCIHCKRPYDPNTSPYWLSLRLCNQCTEQIVQNNRHRTCKICAEPMIPGRAFEEAEEGACKACWEDRFNYFK